MKETYLEPSKLIMPPERDEENPEINQGVFGVYHRLFRNGNGNVIPPVITIKSSSNEDLDNKLKIKIGEIEEYARKINSDPRGHFRYNGRTNPTSAIGFMEDQFKALKDAISDKSHYLIDGRHRSLTATLTGNKIYSLELERDEDIKEVRRMASKGILPEFYREEETISGLADAFEEIPIFGTNEYTNPQTYKTILTPEEFLQLLFRNEELPDYILNGDLE